MFSIRTNVASLGAQRNMSSTNMSLSKSMEKLSSGFRINRAGDDAAGLAISEKLKAQISGLNQAARNSMDGISMIQTAEAGLDEVQSIMQRMRELAVQGSNDTLGSDERVALNNELQELRTEVQNISQRTSFNNQGLLRGTLSSKESGTTTMTTGTYSVSDVTGVDFSKAGGTAAGVTYTLNDAGSGVLELSDGTNTQSITLEDSDFADGASATINFDELGVKLTVSNTSGGNDTAATVATALDGLAVTVTGTNEAKLQTGSGAGDETTVSFLDTRLATADATSELGRLNTALETFDTDKTQGNASALIGAVDNALTFVSKERAKLGAAQNRLEHTIANVRAASENLAASNSRIRDVDVASESAEMARSNILLQAGVSVLAQANQMTQLSLKLLG